MATVEVRDANNGVILQIDDECGRELGSFYVGAGESGSINVPEFAGAYPYAFAVALDGNGAAASVRFGGTTLSWSYGGSGFGYTGGSPCMVYYGVY